MKSALAINLEYFALRGCQLLLNAIPYRLAIAAAKGLGFAAVKIFGFKKARTLSRIREVFPGKSAAEAERIAVKSLQNVLMSGVEMMRAPSLDRGWMDRHVVEGAHYKARLQELVDEGNGVVIMVPHSGNWYMAAWSMAKYGLKLFALAARQRNPKLDAWMNRMYGDIEVLDRDCRDTLVKIKDKLKAGRAFAILPDLRVRKKDVAAAFLRGEANVSHAGAMFAVRAGAPIVVAAMTRENGKHVFNHLATLRPDAAAVDVKAESTRLTREALKILSDFILEHPENWFWYNKRWILEPVDRHGRF